MLEVLAASGGNAEEDHCEPDIDYEEPVASSDGEDAERHHDRDSVPKHGRQSFKRVHENIGHRPVRVLARASRIAGADPLTAAANSLRYEVCDEVR